MFNLSNISDVTIKTKLLWIFLGAGVILYSVFIYLSCNSLTYDAQPSESQKIIFVIQRMLVGLLFFIAIININKLPGREVWLAWIIFTGLFARIILIPSAPVLEDDYFRYMWDGAVTANGFNPYQYSPKDVIDKKARIPDKLKYLADESGGVIEKINHPQMRTLYPSLSQAVFALAYYIFPWSVSGWKIIMLLGDLFLLFFIIKILQQLSLPLVFVSIYWLNPVVIHEFFNTGHYDLFAILFTSISIYYFLRDKYLLSSSALAMAVGFKLWPVLIFPIFLRKINKGKKTIFLNILVFSLLMILIFLPVLFAGWDKNQGFMKYAANWINNAAVYTLLKDSIELFTTLFNIYFVCADCVARWITSGIILVSLMIILRKPVKDNFDFLDKIFLIITISFLVSPTQFPWYLTWLILPLVFSPRISILLYVFLIPLYHLHYIHSYYIYIQHLPVLVLFLYEIKKGAGLGFINRSVLDR